MAAYFNIPQLKNRRRELRNQPIPSEVQMWSVLRGRRFLGLKFRRQHSIGWYIVDFYCPALRLAIEIDGETHARVGQDKKDQFRQRQIQDNGILIVRFRSDEVMNNLDGVLQRLEEFIRSLP